jgi:hypothetical protein
MGLLPDLNDPDDAAGVKLGIKIVVIFWAIGFIGIAGCMVLH